MADLEDLALVRQILEAPWYVGLGCLSAVAAGIGWRQLERRWAFGRRLELERWRHQQKLELELLDHLEDPDHLRAAAEAIASVRRTDPGGSSSHRRRDALTGAGAETTPSAPLDPEPDVEARPVADPSIHRRWRDRSGGSGED